MDMGNKIVFVAYDIPDDSVRLKLISVLQYFGLTRIQYSVFYGSISEHHLSRMSSQITRDFGTGENRILIQEICRSCFERSISLNYPLPREKPSFIVL